MKVWKFPNVVVAIALLALVLGLPAYQAFATSLNRATLHKPTTGPGSCPLADPNQVTTYANIDKVNCSGAIFAKPGVEFASFPQPHNYAITNQVTSFSSPVCQAKSPVSSSDLLQIGMKADNLDSPWTQVNNIDRGFCSTEELRPTQNINPTASYFPPFTHFVIIVKENHTFDDYLGDCTKIYSGCKGQVMSPNHISQAPQLHALAKKYALLDTYSTGSPPPSGPNHWFIFSAQHTGLSEQENYPSTGTQFDRFLNGTNGITETFVMNGDFYWMLNPGQGYWRNPATGQLSWLPVDRPGTTIPDEIHYDEYTKHGISISDPVIASAYLSFLAKDSLPTYSYVELFNDHPGSDQNIPVNDAQTGRIVNSIMSNPAYENNTLIAVTEDDTQNGNNGPDHISNTYRVPIVIIASSKYMKQHNDSHVAYTTSNVLAAMERVMNNVKPGIIDSHDALGLKTFPMTTADQAGLGDPLSALWVNGGGSPLAASASGTPTIGNAPLPVSFTGSATGGTAPYSYSWNFGDGSATSAAQNPSHTYTTAGAYTAKLTVTDSANPAANATSTVNILVNKVGGKLVAAATADTTSGQAPLKVGFQGTGTGGTPPYTYSWDFGDGSATSTAQNPSHTYTAEGTYTATLTVTDSSSPKQSATASISIVVSALGGFPPGPPTNLMATPGNKQVSLSWTAPITNGGVSIIGYRVYRGTTSGGETQVTKGGCSGLTGNRLSCTDTGLTNGQTYYYEVSAVNGVGVGAKSTEASATPTSKAPSNLVQNPGFENGATGWVLGGVLKPSVSTAQAHSGANSLLLGTTSGPGQKGDSFAYQQIAVPAGGGTLTLSYWLYGASNDKVQYGWQEVAIESAQGKLLKMVFKGDVNSTTWQQTTFNASAYIGKTIRLYFDSHENGNAKYYAGMYIDDVSLSEQ